MSKSSNQVVKKSLARPNAPGWLITLEGGEGGGKTTQTIRLKNRLTQLGLKVVALREPGGTAISEQIREVVLSSKNVDMDFTTEVLLFQAARAQIYGEIVLPSLKAGKVVLMDRSRDSSVVYQGMVRGFGADLINNLNRISTKDVYPDITFLLDLPAEIGLRRRMVSGGVDRLDMESTAFHQKVRQAYLEVARQDKTNRWRIVDSTQDIEVITNILWQEITQTLRLPSEHRQQDYLHV